MIYPLGTETWIRARDSDAFDTIRSFLKDEV
jgi:hypothetical protein